MIKAHASKVMPYIFENYGDILRKSGETFSSSLEFYRKGLCNKLSKFYVSTQGIVASCEEAVDAIHKCGGKAFLAHPIEYGDFAEEIITHCEKLVDGIECFHGSASPIEAEKLNDRCLRKGLLVSGGSDYHGKLDRENLAAVEIVGKGLNWAQTCKGI